MWLLITFAPDQVLSVLNHITFWSSQPVKWKQYYQLSYKSTVVSRNLALQILNSSSASTDLKGWQEDTRLISLLGFIDSTHQLINLSNIAHLTSSYSSYVVLETCNSSFRHSSVDDLSPIKQQRNTKSKTRQRKRKRKRRRSTTGKQSPHNQETQDLTWFGNVSTSTGRMREIFIEENTRVTMRSLSQLSMVKF